MRFACKQDDAIHVSMSESFQNRSDARHSPQPQSAAQTKTRREPRANCVSWCGDWGIQQCEGDNRGSNQVRVQHHSLLVSGGTTLDSFLVPENLLRIPHLPPAVFSWVLQSVARRGGI